MTLACHNVISAPGRASCSVGPFRPSRPRTRGVRPCRARPAMRGMAVRSGPGPWPLSVPAPAAGLERSLGFGCGMRPKPASRWERSRSWAGPPGGLAWPSMWLTGFRRPWRMRGKPRCGLIEEAATHSRGNGSVQPAWRRHRGDSGRFRCRGGGIAGSASPRAMQRRVGSRAFKAARSATWCRCSGCRWGRWPARCRRFSFHRRPATSRGRCLKVSVPWRAKP